MNLIKTGATITSVAMTAGEIADILGKTTYLVQLAEDSTKTGAEKLAAVKAALSAYVEKAYPTYTGVFETLWNELAALIGAIVAFYNALGLFKKVAA